ncbi:MAG: AMP-binding protein, partial [Microbacterium sp.]|nr:AMP-binding protein [Microbacterium sp.]
MFHSLLPDVEIPDVSVYDYLFGTLTEEDLARVALIDPATGAETTYGALRAQVNAFAGALAARGVETGTVVGLLCPNVPAFATVFHGILRAGATVTTINSLYTPGEIQKQLTDAGATWLVTVSP